MSSGPKAATSEVMVDNDRVRVTKWSFAPGAETGWHVHDMDYVITPVIGSTVTLVDEAGTETAAEMEAGTSYYRAAGVAHNVINAGPGPLVFVETELK